MPFKQTNRPEQRHFQGRVDPMDPKMAQVVSCNIDDYQNADVVICACPQDEGVRRNHGRPGAAGAPTEIRSFFYRLPRFPGAESLKLFDLGNLMIGGTLEKTHQLQRQVIRRLIEDGKTVLVLGGGNDISYPDVAALADVHPDPLVFNIDAHFDVRQAEQATSGTPYRQLLEEGLLEPSSFYEMGSQPHANSEIYRQYLEERGVSIFDLESLLQKGLIATFENCLTDHASQPVFFGFDMDAVKASDAPGVSAPSPTGFSAEDMVSLAALAGRTPNTRVLEFTEVNPRFDIDGRTSRLVALMMHAFLRQLKS